MNNKKIDKENNKENRKEKGINPEFLKYAERLPTKNGKITLDRNNPSHVAWFNGYE